jgi:hypothetical protein
MCIPARAAQAQAIIPHSLEIALGIAPYSIEKKILELGLAKNYGAIKNVVLRANRSTLQKILLLQLNMALFIADRISFDVSHEESSAFALPEQRYIKTPVASLMNPSMLKKRIRRQWLNYLLIDKELLKLVKFTDDASTLELAESAMQTLYGFLEDISYIYIYFPVNSIEHLKIALIKNFPLLFEPLLILKNTQASGDLQALKKARKLN